MRILWVALLATGVTVTAGCGDKVKTYPVRGTVKFEDGSPAMFGDIEFQAVDQPLNARGKINRDGSFVVGTQSRSDGAVAGEHRVVINQVVTNHFNFDVVHDHGELVHPKYAGYDTSNLKVTVNPDSAGTTLELTVEKRPDP